jgi:cell wall-associated NlpC family hydrolase
MNDLISFVSRHMGFPYVAGANGPDSFDCWGWAQTLQREGFGRHIEAITEPPTTARELMEFVKNHAARTHWEEVPTPVHGGLVEMAHNSRPFHIGVYLDIDGGGITHSVPNIGVTFDSILTLRATGWRKFTFHDWRGQHPA